MTRPDRKMPSLREIAEYWHRRNEGLTEPEKWLKSYDIGLGEPFCFKCGWLAPVDDTVPESWCLASGFLDRAHLITRYLDGLDSVCNIVPLCHACHEGQPDFHPGEEAQALAWLKTTTECPYIWQLATDTVRSAGARATRLAFKMFEAQSVWEKMTDAERAAVGLDGIDRWWRERQAA